MLRHFSLIVFAALFIAAMSVAPAQAGLPTIRVRNALVSPGGTANLYLEIVNNADFGIRGLQFSTELIQPGMTLVHVENSIGIPNFTVRSQQVDGIVNFALFNLSDFIIRPGEEWGMAELSYRVEENVALGREGILSIFNVEMINAQGDVVEHLVGSGAVRVGIRGDVSMNGRVSIQDVVKLVRIIIGEDPLVIFEEIADMNGDGAIDVADVIAQVNNILGIVAKPIAGPIQPVGVGLGELVVLDGQMFIPVTASADGLVAGLQAEIAFDPSALVIGQPRLGSGITGMELASYQSNGTLRLILYPTHAGGGIQPGVGNAILVPVELSSGGATEVRLNNVVVANSQAAVVPSFINQAAITATNRAIAPSKFALIGNAPNPFNPATTIGYDVSEPARITLVVYNLLGQEVARLVDATQLAGRYTAVWNGRDSLGRDVASGIYLYRLTSSTGFSQTKRMTLLK